MNKDKLVIRPERQLVNEIRKTKLNGDVVIERTFETEVYQGKLLKDIGFINAASGIKRNTYKAGYRAEFLYESPERFYEGRRRLFSFKFPEGTFPLWEDEFKWVRSKTIREVEEEIVERKPL